MRHNLILLFALFIMLSAFKVDKPVVTVFMIGDSTMANKSLIGENPERGWGQMLSSFLSEEIRVDNRALNGRSSKSFIEEGHWDKVLSSVKKGDYIFIQFGHNDEKADSSRYTKPGETFDDNLRKFVNETRAKGGIPVLFNSIVRRNFEEIDTNKKTAQLADTHGTYLNSPRNVAKELNVPFVDMNKLTHDLVESLGVEESKKLFMWIAPNTVPSIPKGLEDNTHLNIYGGRTFARLAVKAIEETVPELGKHICYYDFVVAKDGSGDFFTVQEAINAVPDFRKNIRTTILVKKGSYKEKLIIPESKINISLIGQDGAVLTYDDYSSKLNYFGETKGTSGSSSCYIYAPDFYAENITFKNSSGPIAQAVACFVSADRAFFKKCRFLGFQDTLYTYAKGYRQYYEDCYIEGTVDFIFGWSTAVFNRCHIHSKDDGFITAPSTDAGQKYGYVFYDCKLTANTDVNDVYLSRPWRPYAQAVFIHCNLGKHIIPVGWHNWDKKDNERTAFYAEYESKGEGANPKMRAPFSHQLENIEDYKIEAVLAGTDGWNPVLYGNKLLDIKL